MYIPYSFRHSSLHERVSLHERDRQTDTAGQHRQDSLAAIMRASRGNKPVGKDGLLNSKYSHRTIC